MVRRLVPSVAIAVLALFAVGAPASAHIDPDPKEAQAGSRLTVGFTVEHGCEGSPTVRLDMRLPDGVVDPVAEPVDGWTGSVDTTTDGTIVSFVGGPLADDVEGTFGVTMTLPPTPDSTIFFPFVQRCEVGEIRWIGIPAEPGDDLDEPAPAMVLIGPVATTVPAPTTTAGAPTTSPRTTVPDTAPPTTAPRPPPTQARTPPHPTRVSRS
jgi:periplasmic copper chaperone A